MRRFPALLLALAASASIPASGPAHAQDAPAFCCIEGLSGIGDGDAFDALFTSYNRESWQAQFEVGGNAVTGTATDRAKLLLDEAGLPPKGKVQLRQVRAGADRAAAVAAWTA